MVLANLSSILIPFLTIFCLLVLGIFLRRRRIVTPDGVRQITGLVLNVTLPPLIFCALATEITPAELRRAPLLVASGILGPLIGYAVAAAMARLPLFPRARRSTVHAAVGMLNTTFVGYAVCQALLGSRGLLYAVLYDAGFTLVMSTLSIWFMSWAGKRGADSLARSLRDLARSPLLWSVVLGVAWGMLGWPVPSWVWTPLSTLGQATMPMALLAVGMLVQPRAGMEGLEASVLREAQQTGDTAWRQLGFVSVARLLIVPALVWGLVMLLRVERTAAAVMVLQTAMPTAVATTAMSEQYGGDSAFAAAGVIATTFLSLLTLPLWGWVLVGG